MENQQPVALEIASQIELAITCGFIGSAEQYDHLLLSAVSQLRRLHARVEELESVAADHIAQPRKMVAAQEPFGYFKAEPFGWRDCAETDEGAIALYEAPQPQADARDVEQPRLTVRLTSFPESNGKRNWTAMFVRAEPWDGLIGNAGGITIKHGELWNRVAYEAERARFLIGERDTEPYILDYIADIQTPDAWTGESLALSRQQRR